MAKSVFFQMKKKGEKPKNSEQNEVSHDPVAQIVQQLYHFEFRILPDSNLEPS